MREIADRVYVLGTRAHNFYLVRSGDELTMVDAGCSKEWKYVADGVEKIGLNIDAIKSVIVTHAHSDHFGLATRAETESIDIHVHHDEETRALGRYRGRFSASSRDMPVWRPHVLRMFVPMMLRGVTDLAFPDHVTTFGDEEELDVPGRPVAIHTPGHTEGHAMFHLPDRGVLFTGDGLATMNLLRGGQDGPQVLDEVFNLDQDQTYASLQHIEEIDAGTLLPGHGPKWTGSPAVAAQHARARRTGAS